MCTCIECTVNHEISDYWPWIGFVACCRIFFMLSKNHRARCSNNGCELDGISPTSDDLDCQAYVYCQI
jgi:hypothetical protein